MKAVILAGGMGTRLSEETVLRPKPMVEIGGKPILWHIMKIFSVYGINEFIICCGYKGHMIKEYFSNYALYRSNVTFDLPNNIMKVHQSYAEPWTISLIDTGESTLTGGRLKQVQKYVGEETFCFTYGDGVSDVNIRELIHFHRSEGLLATLTAVQPPARFGSFTLRGQDTYIHCFSEKLQSDEVWINGGFFVLEPGVFEYISNDMTAWENEPLQELARRKQLAAYKHKGFWQCMDTIRDKQHLDEMWASTRAAWKVWE